MLPVIPLKVLLYSLFRLIPYRSNGLRFLSGSLSLGGGIGWLANRCAILFRRASSSVACALRRTAFHPSSAKVDYLWLRHMALAEGLVGFANRCAILLSEAPSSVATRLTSNYVLHPSSAKGSLWLRHMAWAEGFEPPTLGLEIRCSIQLSYVT